MKRCISALGVGVGTTKKSAVSFASTKPTPSHNPHAFPVQAQPLAVASISAVPTTQGKALHRGRAIYTPASRLRAESTSSAAICTRCAMPSSSSELVSPPCALDAPAPPLTTSSPARVAACKQTPPVSSAQRGRTSAAAGSVPLPRGHRPRHRRTGSSSRSPPPVGSPGYAAE